MGLENLKSVFNDLTSNVKEPVEKISSFEPPQVARVSPDNKSMIPTLQSGKGSQIGDSVFLDATGNSRFSIGEDPNAKHPIDFSILDKLPNIARVFPDNESMSPTLSIGESGIETRFATISKQGATPIKKEELSILDGLPNIATVAPDNESMSPTLQSGKGLPIPNSVFLDATGISRFSEGVDPVATHPIDFSILDGLPNIARVSPDNQSMNPTLNTGIGLISRHSHDILSGDEFNPDINVIHHENHSALDNIGDNLVERNLLRSTAPIQVLEIGDLEVVNYTPLVNSGVGINSGQQTFDGLLTGNMATRKFDITTLGKNSRLGEGDFTLGTLFKHNHRGSPQRTTIDTGKIDHKGNKIIINTGRAGIGSLSNLDIKGYSSFYRNGIGFLKEPYIVHNIPEKEQGITDFISGVGNDRDLIPFAAAIDDVSRLAQFYTSPAGILFMAKENITNMLYGARSNNSISKVSTDVFDKIMAPPIPVPMTGFLNNYHQKIQGAGFGSIRKPFTIQYSDRFNIGIAGNNLGDRTIGLKKALNSLELKEKQFIKTESEKKLNQAGSVAANAAIKTRNIAVAGLKSLRDATVRGLDKIPNIPMTQKPTDLLDTSGFGNWSDSTPLSDENLHGSKDVFAKNHRILADKVKLEDIPNLIKEGDFYVRIKDLRNGTSLYFRGYVTGITENVSPSWSPTNYIGRSEPVYMYERAERDLSFNLRVYPQDATHQRNIYQNIEALTSLAYPQYMGKAIATDSDGNDVMFADERMKPPFTELYMAHIGTKNQGQFGFIKSLSYTVPGEGDWDALNRLPRLFDIAISYQILGKRPPSSTNGSMGHTRTFYGANRG